MSEKVPMRVGYYQIETLKPEPGVIEVQMLAEMPFVNAAFLSDDGPRVEVNTKLFGAHNFQNVMTAIALGVYFKVPAEKIKAALENYTPSNNRSQLIERNGATILLDAYNANPSSMEPALKSLCGMPAKRRLAILGDMLELGENSQNEHEDLLRFAASLQLDQIVLVGKEFGKTSFEKYGALHFDDNQAAKVWFEAQDLNGAAVLIKGSRGIRLELVIGK